LIISSLYRRSRYRDLIAKIWKKPGLEVHLASRIGERRIGRQCSQQHIRENRALEAIIFPGALVGAAACSDDSRPSIRRGEESATARDGRFGMAAIDQYNDTIRYDRRQASVEGDAVETRVAPPRIGKAEPARSGSADFPVTAQIKNEQIKGTARSDGSNSRFE
jgi:hypothetical protein